MRRKLADDGEPVMRWTTKALVVELGGYLLEIHSGKNEAAKPAKGYAGLFLEWRTYEIAESWEGGMFHRPAGTPRWIPGEPATGWTTATPENKYRAGYRVVLPHTLANEQAVSRVGLAIDRLRKGLMSAVSSGQAWKQFAGLARTQLKLLMTPYNKPKTSWKTRSRVQARRTGGMTIESLVKNGTVGGKDKGHGG